MKNKNINQTILIIFIIISLMSGMITYRDVYDVLPIIATVLSVIFTWQPSTKILRIGQVFICTLWIIYDIFVIAYIGILTESIIIVTTIIALLNNDYNIDIKEIIYLKIRLKAKDEYINLSTELPVLVSSKNIKKIKEREL